MVALYISRHVCAITKGSQFEILSTFTCVDMMTSTAVGVGAVAAPNPKDS